MKFSILILLLGLVIHLPSKGAEISINGVYQGKNLYVQNPFANDGKEYCTSEVYVNGKLNISSPKVGAFEIDLSFLPINSPVEIKIIYKDGCGPKIVNPQVITFDSDFKFLVCQVTDMELKWITQKESIAGIYSIEKLEGEDWVSIAEVNSKGSVVNNFYKIPAKHQNGKNIYRIKFTQAEGITLYSKEMEYNGEPQPLD